MTLAAKRPKALAWRHMDLTLRIFSPFSVVRMTALILKTDQTRMQPEMVYPPYVATLVTDVAM